MSYTQAATDLLLSTGWRPAGRTKPETRYFYWGPVIFPGRLRFAKGPRRVTVGERTICFYQRTKTGADQHIRVKANDLREILEQI